MITGEDNDSFNKDPTMEELKNIVFSMNPVSAAAPDGLNGKFFQHCWEIIKNDLFNVVNAFFCGHPMPKFMTQACLVLLPKVEFPNNLSEFRPISLSNFLNKIISKILCSRIAPILPRIITPNQTGFVKGRSISENIMLAQEIVQGIKKPNVGANVVIKLDMEKAYDRVSWSFNCIRMRRMGFSEKIIDMFFNGFNMEKRGPQVTHLCFADDVIIFTLGCRTSLMKIMAILQDYEQAYGQQINKNKSHFMIASSIFNYTNRRIQQLKGFSRKGSPITYLGCPLYTGRKRIVHFNSLISKVVSRIRGWHGRLLSYGGRVTLIKHVLQSLPIHLLSAVSPPKTVLRKIEKLAANFFWGMEKDKNKYHWASWQKLCHTKEEGGIGLRSIEDVCRAMEYKQWWLFRTKETLWGDFLMAKYCKRSHPISKKWDSGQSQTWKRMMINKKEAENHIQWRLHSGNSRFWWDNWLEEANFPINKMTWHRHIPFKWSICLWRALRNKFPTDDRTDRFGPLSVNRCVCCIKPGAESIDHIFSTGYFARVIWKDFNGPVGIHSSSQPLRITFMNWWLLKRNNAVQKLLLDTLPIIICWNLWKNRCAAKYGGKTSTITKTLYSITSDVILLLTSTQPNTKWPSNWEEIYHAVENLKHLTEINSDGSALINPGKIGAGIIIRDHQGHFIYAIASPLGEGTNNKAETQAAYLGIKWSIENVFSKIHLEADSKLLILWLTTNSDPPWSLDMLLQKTKSLSQQCEDIIYSYVFREANYPADSLSKISHDLTSITHYNTSMELPSHIRGQVILDQQGTPAFRHKKTSRVIFLPQLLTDNSNVHVSGCGISYSAHSPETTSKIGVRYREKEGNSHSSMKSTHSCNFCVLKLSSIWENDQWYFFR
ncbi:PREDICTED: uncharacterized protein LOC109239280 [Nicotiana attenuata]|uniref:uncharacterized protein LOC109239280 n=1 Tax=Nicotiana attenuata TaxID=49451 RepID=UPI0009048ACC|nr:PREDICTED: uncharacterized protein LOC109239280 [Nicotiana attenuata]